MERSFRCLEHLLLRILTGLFVCVLMSTTSLGEGEPEKRFTVASQYLGMAGGSNDASKFVTALQAGLRCKATAVRSTSSWRKVPSSTGRDEYVSVVTLGFDEQAEAYAFQFAGPGGGVSHAVHIPYGKTHIPLSDAWIWIPPTENLADLFLVEAQLGSARKVIPLALKVVEWQDSSEDEVVDDAGGIEDMLQDNTDQFLALPTEKALPILEVMAYWAAWANGWRPGVKEAAARVELAVQMRHKAANLRLRMTSAAGTSEIVKTGVPEEHLQAYLERLFRKLKLSDTVHDFARVSTGTITLLAAGETFLTCSRRGIFYSYNSASGKQTIPPVSDIPAKKGRRPPPPISYMRKDGAIYRYDKKIALVDVRTGEEQSLIHEGTSRGWAFSTGETQALILASGWEVKSFQGPKQRWQKSWSCPVQSGPLLLDDQIIIGSQRGEAVALAAADGRERWKTELPGPLYGPIVYQGQYVLVFSNGDETLYALEPTGGKIAWKRPVGDVLKAAPKICDGRVLLASKSNRLFLIDGKTGSLKHKRDWPTWLVSVSTVRLAGRDLIVCTDLEGGVSFLDPSDLETVRRVDLHTPLTPGILPVARFPLKWAAASESKELDDGLSDGSDVANGPVVLVSDRDGFFYLLAVPEG